jgi:Holliday junction resolvasome RuvABC endonuclease subunit
MAYLLGLDPSLAKSGYVVLDTEAPDGEVVEKGKLKTSTSDGITVLRLIKQQNQLRELIQKYDIKFVGMEAPYYGGWTAEILFALNQFLHKLFLDLGTYVVAFPPQQLKKLVFPTGNVKDIKKPQMIDKAKTALGLHGKVLAEDVADAYWAGIFGKKFYKRHVVEETTDKDLNKYEIEVFSGTHTYTRGAKKGITDYNGIIYQENSKFWNFKKIKRRALDGSSKKDDQKSSKKDNKKG